MCIVIIHFINTWFDRCVPVRGS